MSNFLTQEYIDILNEIISKNSCFGISCFLCPLSSSIPKDGVPHELNCFTRDERYYNSGGTSDTKILRAEELLKYDFIQKLKYI